MCKWREHATKFMYANLISPRPLKQHFCSVFLSSVDAESLLPAFRATEVVIGIVATHIQFSVSQSFMRLLGVFFCFYSCMHKNVGAFSNYMFCRSFTWLLAWAQSSFSFVPALFAIFHSFGFVPYMLRADDSVTFHILFLCIPAQNSNR